MIQSSHSSPRYMGGKQLANSFKTALSSLFLLPGETPPESVGHSSRQSDLMREPVGLFVIGEYR